MRTTKVGKITYIKNYFRHNGKIANEVIDYAKLQNIPIYQRVFKDGSIGLKPQMKDDIFVLIHTDGSISRTERRTRKYNSRFGLATLWKKVTTLFTGPLKEKIVTKEKFYINKHLEESAIREYNKGGPVLNSVTSYHNRKTKFPVTETGGNMHNFNIQKIKDEYGEFRMLYTENYPHT